MIHWVDVDTYMFRKQICLGNKSYSILKRAKTSYGLYRLELAYSNSEVAAFC